MKRVIYLCVLFTLITGNANLASAPPAASSSLNTMSRGVSAQGQVTIGGRNQSRAGEGSLFSSFFDQARASLELEVPGVAFSSTQELTPDFLAGLDVLVLTSFSTQPGGSSPLMVSEQLAVREFVMGGGDLLVLLENSDAAELNQSLAGPFGLQVDGKTEAVTATVASPTAHPITNGRFGPISSFSQTVAGTITPPSSAVCLATNPLGCALTVFNPGALSPRLWEGEADVTSMKPEEPYSLIPPEEPA